MSGTSAARVQALPGGAPPGLEREEIVAAPSHVDSDIEFEEPK